MPVEGKIKVALTLKESLLSRTHYAIFLIVKLSLRYNARKANVIQLQTNIMYWAMKCLTNNGVDIVQEARGSR